MNSQRVVCGKIVYTAALAPIIINTASRPFRHQVSNRHVLPLVAFITGLTGNFQGQDERSFWHFAEQ